MALSRGNKKVMRILAPNRTGHTHVDGALIPRGSGKHCDQMKAATLLSLIHQKKTINHHQTLTAFVQQQAP